VKGSEVFIGKRRREAGGNSLTGTAFARFAVQRESTHRIPHRKACNPFPKVEGDGLGAKLL
jgi:hypothetical protein